MTGRNVFHIFAFDVRAEHILVDHADNNGWLAPAVTYDGPYDHRTIVIANELTELGITGWPVHDDRLTPRDASIAHSYCAVIVRALDRVRYTTWMRLDAALKSSAFLDIQRTALTICVDRFLHPVAQLDSPQRVEASETWARAALRARGYTLVDAPQLLKHKRDRRVVSWATTSGPVYLKVADTVPREVRVTDALADMCPEHFVRTIVVCAARGWWLYEGLAGSALSLDRLTPELGERLGATVASVQQRSMHSREVHSALHSRQLLESDLIAVVDLAEHLTRTYAITDDQLAAMHRDSAWRAIREVCSDTSRLPWSFLHGDLWPHNIVGHNASLGFIDVENARWGPIALTWWPILNQLRARALQHVADKIVNAYVHEWSGRCRAPELAKSVHSIEVIGRVAGFKRRLDQAGVTTSDYPRLAHESRATDSRIHTLRLLLGAQLAIE